MTPVPQDELDKVIEAINKKGANKPCPRCGKDKFTLLDSYFNQPVQDKNTGFALGTNVVPCAVTYCNNCGFISQHALGILGLLKKKKD